MLILVSGGINFLVQPTPFDIMREDTPQMFWPKEIHLSTEEETTCEAVVN